jgi:hypothetical protein
MQRIKYMLVDTAALTVMFNWLMQDIPVLYHHTVAFAHRPVVVTDSDRYTL